MKKLVLIIAVFFNQRILCVHSIFADKQISNSSDISEACINIIDSCYSEDSYNLVLYGDINSTVQHSILHKKQTFNMLRFNSMHHFHNMQFFRRPAIFVIMVRIYKDLENSLKNLWTFPLWDINMPFFILNNSTGKETCQDVYNFLKLSWTYNLLFCYFLCRENGQVIIWTFNPFTNIAPSEWIIINNSKDPWTLFRQLYHHDEVNCDFCKSLKWDKAKKLNNYPVKAIGTYVVPSLIINSTDMDMKNWMGIDGQIMQIIFSAMNVTVIMTYNNAGITGKIDENNKPTGLYKEIADGNQDVMMNSMFMRYLKNTTIIPLNLISGIKFIVQKNKTMSTLQKIIRYLGFSLIFITAGITVMTLMVLKYVSRRPTGLALLEIVRLLANGGFIQPPRSLPARIYLGPVLFFYLSFQAIFQGELAAILTKPVPEINLKSPNDLKTHPEYKLYMAEAITSYVDEEIRNLSIITPAISCEDYVLKSSKAVCITSEGFLMIPTALYDLHMPELRLYTNFEVYRTRKDWPLEDKFRKLVLLINQAGILRLWKQKSMNYSKEKIKDLHHRNNIAKFNIVTMTELMFAFKGLSYGLFLALFVYFIEIRIWIPVIKLVKRIIK